MSAESGIRTFREAGGLWEEYDIYEVATPEAFDRDPHLVLRFYNERRAQLRSCQPNEGHTALVEMEQDFRVSIITQNVDDLHERAGSKNILHLHGELTKARSVSTGRVFDCPGDINWGDLCPDGGQLRPHVVWFGEQVPAMEQAAHIASGADILVIIGTSMQVYPAAGLVHYVGNHIPKYVIDPNAVDMPLEQNVHYIRKGASEGTRQLLSILRHDR